MTITEENVRYPLPEPSDGVTLATAVGAYTAALIQHARDLKDAVLAAEDEDELTLVDTESGGLNEPAEGPILLFSRLRNRCLLATSKISGLSQNSSYPAI